MQKARTARQDRRPAVSILLLILFLIACVGGASAAGTEADTLVYTVEAGDSLIKVCGKHRDRTNHYALNDLMTDIRRTNDLKSNLLLVGQQLRIPVLPIQDCPRARTLVTDGAELRGIYLTGPACGVSSVWRRVDHFIAAGGNAVVFDGKDIDGGVSFASEHPLADWGKGRGVPVISSLGEMLHRFERRDMYVVARLALFLDGELGRQRPDLALQDSTGNPWSERGCVWMDPRQPEVRAYNLTLAQELARAGVDEIQFDYVRFPTNGWREDWSDTATVDLAEVAARRRAAITDFLAEARDLLKPLGVKISADLYGIMAWGRTEDLALTGQHVPTFAEYVDVICPMIYPSHFGPGFEGRKRPGDDPEYFIGEGTRRFAELAAGQAEIRPWLQAFPYRVSQFDADYIGAQIEAARLEGGQGWCLWNPACRYSVALQILPSLCIPQPKADPADVLGSVMTASTTAGNPATAPAVKTEPTALLGSFLGAGHEVQDKTGEIQKPAE